VRRLSALALIPAGIAVAVSRTPEVLVLSAAAILALIVILGILAIVTAVLFARSGEPASRLDQLMRTILGSPSKRHHQLFALLAIRSRTTKIQRVLQVVSPEGKAAPGRLLHLAGPRPWSGRGDPRRAPGTPARFPWAASQSRPARPWSSCRPRSSPRAKTNCATPTSQHRDAAVGPCMPCVPVNARTDYRLSVPAITLQKASVTLACHLSPSATASGSCLPDPRILC
jgi:hypothetical protein